MPPKRLPWSVSAIAGNLRSLAFFTSCSSWAAPSSRLYSEWTCRWTNSACCTAGRLLELDGGRGLVRDVVEHGVDALEAAERVRQFRHQRRRQWREVRGHAVARVHRPQDDRLAARPRAQRQHRHRHLPDRVVEAAGAHEARDKVVGGAQHGDSLGREGRWVNGEAAEGGVGALEDHRGDAVDRPVLVRHAACERPGRLGLPEPGNGQQPRVAALVALHADRADRDDPALGPRRQGDRGRLERLHRRTRLGPQAAHGETRAGERVAPHHVVRQPQLLAEHAYLVLVEVDERLDDAARVDQRLDALDTVVVRLDLRGVARAARLDRVGIDGPLPEQPLLLTQAQPRELVLLHGDERLADDGALVLGMDDAAQAAEEVGAAVDAPDRAGTQRRRQILHGLGVALAHEARVDVEAEHALRAERPRAEGERDGGVHTAADEEEHLAVAGGAADVGDDLVDAGARIPVLAAAADVEDEGAVDLGAVLGVDDLGMELQAEQPAAGMLHRGHLAVVRLAGDDEARRHVDHRVAVAHPDGELARGQAAKEPALARVQRGVAIFLRRPRLDAAREIAREQLVAVADAEDRHAELVDRAIHRRARRLRDAGRPPRDDEAACAPEVGGGPVDVGDGGG